MSSAVPIVCAGCARILGGTTFYEDGQPYHHGCRPSQLNTQAAEMWPENEMRSRIAELEAEQSLHDAELDAFTARAEQAEAALAERDAFIEHCRASGQIPLSVVENYLLARAEEKSVVKMDDPSLRSQFKRSARAVEGSKDES